MLKTGMLLCAMSLAAVGARASDVIQAEKMTKDQFSQALQAAPDDAVIEYQGQNKTKAEWRSYFQAKFTADTAGMKQLADQRQAKVDADAKALQDQQNKAVADENAQIMKDFNAR